MSLANKVFAAREQAKNKINQPVSTPVQPGLKYKFLNPSNNMEQIQKNIYEDFMRAARCGDGYDIQLSPFYLTGSFKTPAEFLVLLRNHPVYAEWLPEFEECMIANNTYISNIGYYEYNRSLEVYIEDKILQNEVKLNDDFKAYVDDIFDEIKDNIEDDFMSDIDINETAVFIELGDVPLVSNIPEIALTKTPILNEVYAEFKEWITNNGLQITKMEFSDTSLCDIELTVAIVV